MDNKQIERDIVKALMERRMKWTPFGVDLDPRLFKEYDMIKETTVVFSGCNMKNYAILAIESFLKFYPQMKENIIWFDDNSTDGTLEWMQENNIKVITWKHHKDDVVIQNYNELYGNLAMKCTYIIREIFLQVDSQYLLINDGDVYFTRGGFLEEHFSQAQWKAIFPKGKYPTTIFKKDTPDSLQKYSILIEESSLIRAWLYHGLIDLGYFKSKDIIFDRINDQEYNKRLGNTLECGHDFYYQIKSQNIPYVYKPEEEFDYVHHIGWIGSYCAHIKMNGQPMGHINKEMERRIQKCINDPVVNEICTKYKLNLFDILL